MAQVGIRGGPVMPPALSLAYGDSKSTSPAYLYDLEAYSRLTFHPMRMSTVGVGGATAAILRARVDSDLAAITQTHENVLINVGANDVTSLPTQAAFESDLGYIMDAMHVKWPSARVFVMRGPWRVNEGADCATLKGWIGNVTAARSGWAFNGPDETVFIENGDNGATYMPTGEHPNAAGYALTGLKWAQALGYAQ